MNVVLPKGVYSVSGETAIFSIHDKKDYEIHEIVQLVGIGADLALKRTLKDVP